LVPHLITPSLARASPCWPLASPFHSDLLSKSKVNQNVPHL